MFERLSFLHVADVVPDRPLRETGPLPASVETVVQDANLIAFDQMIEGAIDQAVDFVLLTGETILQSPANFRVKTRISEGFVQLAEHGIDVYVLGETEPVTSLKLPENVTFCHPDTDHPNHVPTWNITRNGHRIAKITAGTPDQLAHHSWNTDAPKDSAKTNGHVPTNAFRIGLISSLGGWEMESREALSDGLSQCRCDYLAVPARGLFEPGETWETKDGIAHHPGSLQPWSPDAYGPHGGTRIDVEPDGRVNGTFLPFAAVRRLQFSVPLEADTTPDDVVNSITATLEKQVPQPGEQVWLVTWQLTGHGELFEHLFNADDVELLKEELLPWTGENDEVQIHHRIVLRETAAPLGRSDQDRNELLASYYDCLEQPEQDLHRVMRDILSEMSLDFADFDSLDDQRRLSKLADCVETADAWTMARSLGRDWFPQTAE